MLSHNIRIAIIAISALLLWLITFKKKNTQRQKQKTESSRKCFMSESVEVGCKDMQVLKVYWCGVKKSEKEVTL